MKSKIGRLHVITDMALQSRYSHPELAQMAIDGGADTIQLRDKSDTSLDLFRNAEKMKRICSDANVPLIINDRLDVALAVDADGVHLGQTDLPIAAARRIIGDNKLIGGSATDFEELEKVIGAGADYVGFGPAFPTGSKKNPGAPKGVEHYTEVAKHSIIPVVAIGGIKLHHVDALFTAGIHGIAVISAICCADDPRNAAADFIMKIAAFSS
jgi:thiamine-phosphate pyrophosphorylase